MANKHNKINAEIFISYSRKDTKKVKYIITWLQQQGFSEENIFIDQHNIDGAGVFPKVIANAIKSCKVLIFFASNASVNSDWVKNEVYYALKFDKKVLPVFLENVELEEEFDISLSRIQQLNLWDGQEDERLVVLKKSLVAIGVSSLEDSKGKSRQMLDGKKINLPNWMSKTVFQISVIFILVFIALFFIFKSSIQNAYQSLSIERNDFHAINESIKKNDDPELNPDVNDSEKSTDSLSLYYSFHVKRQNGMEEIFNGSTIHSGDRIQIRIMPSTYCFLYIFNQDAVDDVYMLFPIEGYSNHLKANKEIVIPAQNKYILVDTQSGQEKLFILASTTPMDFLSDLIAKFNSNITNEDNTDDIKDLRKRLVSRGLSQIVENNDLSIKKLSNYGEDFNLKRYIKGTNLLFKEITFAHK